MLKPSIDKKETSVNNIPLGTRAGLGAPLEVDPPEIRRREREVENAQPDKPYTRGVMIRSKTLMPCLDRKLPDEKANVTVLKDDRMRGIVKTRTCIVHEMNGVNAYRVFAIYANRNIGLTFKSNPWFRMKIEQFLRSTNMCDQKKVFYSLDPGVEAAEWDLNDQSHGVDKESLDRISYQYILNFAQESGIIGHIGAYDAFQGASNRTSALLEEFCDITTGKASQIDTGSTTRKGSPALGKAEHHENNEDKANGQAIDELTVEQAKSQKQLLGVKQEEDLKSQTVEAQAERVEETDITARQGVAKCGSSPRPKSPMIPSPSHQTLFQPGTRASTSSDAAASAQAFTKVSTTKGIRAGLSTSLSFDPDHSSNTQRRNARHHSLVPRKETPQRFLHG
ncbi:hypothetical protein EJ08DRAFT_735067 [Tothia fuscella]|uniref:Uncharacterized protein n=1 Tax=Tothia fuscella TaxID=1048955 RepID=A0A9P4NQ57_9PEZI|nr:hypothetical protein EJ08DRAFT_735067 [Tothia fuscella]